MKKFKSQSGFTLIEIVMVLILLGILAAVAVPKYFDLQEKAEIQAAKAVVAEVQARINGEFAQRILSGSDCVTARNEVGALVNDTNIVIDGFNIALQGWAAGKGGEYVLAVTKEGASPAKDVLNTKGKVAIPVCSADSQPKPQPGA